MSPKNDDSDMLQSSAEEEDDLSQDEEMSIDESDDDQSDLGVEEDDDDENEEDEEEEDESDDDDEDSDEVDDDEDIPKPKEKQAKALKPENATKSKLEKIERIANKIRERNAQRQGLQLFLRFPKILPAKYEDFHSMVTDLSDKIVGCHKPRQRYARFCLVDFATNEDRDSAFKELSGNDQGIYVALPRTDNENFVNHLIQKKIEASGKRSSKNLLNEETKSKVGQKRYSTAIRVLNIPSTATIAQIKELFPDSVDIQTKKAPEKYAGLMMAAVTMPTTILARDNCKRKLELGGKQLILRFIKPHFKSNRTPQKGPVAPPKDDAVNSPEANGVKAPASVTAPSSKKTQQLLKKKPLVAKKDEAPPKKINKPSAKAPNTNAKTPKSIANPPKTIANPPNSIAKSSKIIAKPSKIIAKPSKVIAKLPKSIAKQVTTNGKPESVKKPAPPSNPGNITLKKKPLGKPNQKKNLAPKKVK